MVDKPEWLPGWVYICIGDRRGCPISATEGRGCPISAKEVLVKKSGDLLHYSVNTAMADTSYMYSLVHKNLHLIPVMAATTSI